MREPSRRRIDVAHAKVARVVETGAPLRTSSRIMMSILRSRVPLPCIHQPAVRYGGCYITADLRTSLGLSLYRYGNVSADVRSVLGVLSPGDGFIDGGANVGLFTLPAAAHVGPRGSVFAIEPGRISTQLERNLALNDFENVRVVRAALDGRDGMLRSFQDLDGEAAGLSSFVADTHPTGHSVTVRTRTLDALANEIDAPIRVVKLDLEGAEVQALHGAERVLTEIRPIFLVEVEDAHLRRQGSTADTLLRIFAANGYRRVHDAVSAPNMWFEPNS